MTTEMYLNPDSVELGVHVEEYYRRYGPMVLRRCRKLLKNEDKALDAMQEVFVKVLLHKERLKHQYPSSLLFRMATNVCLNVIRAEKIRLSTSEDDILTNIAFFEEKEDQLIINNLLDYVFRREKQSTREIAVMHFVDGMTLMEVADEVGLSLSGVRKRLRELRSRIKTYDFEETPPANFAGNNPIAKQKLGKRQNNEEISELE